MLKRDFEELNKKQKSLGLPTFANPRNLAAGTIRQLDPALVAARPLHFRGYDVIRMIVRKFQRIVLPTKL